MGDFKKLRVWREARELVALSNSALMKLPSQEKYLLADQWRRAAYSVPLNIAEGTGRQGPKEFRRFLGIALGSLHELDAVRELVESLAYIPSEEIAVVQAERAVWV